MTIACSSAVFSRRSLDEAVAGAAALGFDALDCLMIDGWCHVHPSALVADEHAGDALDALCARHGVRLAAANVGFSPSLWQREAEVTARGLAEVRAVSRFLAARGVNVAALQPRGPNPELSAEENLTRAAATLREYADAAGELGVTYALECHSGSIAETVAAALDLVDRVPGLKLAYDPSHFVMLEIPLDSTVPLFEHSVAVHLRDAAPGAMQARYGDGRVDFDWVTARLAELGYTGVVSIEYLDQAEIDVGEDARALAARLRAGAA